MSWLGFAAPLWLAGLAALCMPIAIHWLSRGRRRRVKIGSVRWLTEAEATRARRVSPSRWWLLLVRCLLLAQVVAALALPRLAIDDAGGRPWLLVAPEVARDRDRLERDNVGVYRRLDGQLGEGGELHWLTARAPRGEFESPPEAAPGDLWSWIQEAHRSASPGTEFAVFAAGRVEQLRGARPALGRAIDWHEVTDPQPNRWIERAVPIGEGGLALFVASSDRGGTRYERVDVPPPAPAALPAPALVIERQTASWRVTLTDGGRLEVDDTIDFSSSVAEVEVAILFAAERAEDARHIRTALEAVREAAALPLVIRAQVVDSAAEVEVSDAFTDVSFWLSPEPVPPVVRNAIRLGGSLISDALDRFEHCDCALVIGSSAPPVRFDRTGPVDEPAGATVPLWTTADGVVLLEAERLNEGVWLRYHSRFHPAWTDLVLAAALPEWLLELVEQVAPPASSSRVAASDRRSAAGQGEPQEGGHGEDSRTRSGLPLEPWLWLAVIILAFGERLMAARSVA